MDVYVEDDKNDNDNVIISDLKFITKISPNTYIDTKIKILYDKNIFGKIYRTYFQNDTHINLLNFIEKIINNSFDLLIKYKKTNIDKYQNIYNDLTKSIDSINNIKITYVDNNYFCCQLDTLIDDIKIRLKNIE